MARASTINISLSGALGRYVRDKVASGDYESPSEVIAASLEISRAVEQQQTQFWISTNEKVAQARREIASGEFSMATERWMISSQNCPSRSKSANRSGRNEIPTHGLCD